MKVCKKNRSTEVSPLTHVCIAQPTSTVGNCLNSLTIQKGKENNVLNLNE